MSSLASRIDASILTAIVGPPRTAGQQRIMATFGAQLPGLLERFDIVTPLRISHFLAQVAHESDGFRTTEEYASGSAYEGRVDLGNRQPGDGKRFKGRGPIQQTGREHYRNFTLWLRSFVPDCPDFEREPDLVATFPWAGWSAVWFWTVKKLNILAERDDLVAVTKVVNGGRNGLADRANYLGKAKSVIAKLIADAIGGDRKMMPLHRGSTGVLVGQLQRALVAAGPHRLAIDESFGPATELALRDFQRANGLTVDGIAGPQTLAALAPFMRAA